MDRNEQRKLDMFTRVVEFGQARTTDFPAGSPGRALFDGLAGAIARMQSSSATQVTSQANARQGTHNKTELRETLLETLGRIQRTARALAVTQSGIARKFQIPKRLSDKTLVAVARSFAEQAAPMAADFRGLSMPAGFLDILAAQTDAFASSLGERKRAMFSQNGATRSIDEAVAQGMGLLTQIDAVVRNEYYQDKTALADWEQARRADRISRAGTANSGSGEGESAQK
ncbi:MAG: hypothetical protein ACKV2V_13275 [Blastocatellia bacterium]